MVMGRTKNTFATLTHIQPARAKTFNYPVVEKYHLWKVNLAMGLWSCKCFPRLFRKKDGDSNSSGHCLVVLFSFLPTDPVLLQSWSRPLPCWNHGMLLPNPIYVWFGQYRHIFAQNSSTIWWTVHECQARKYWMGKITYPNGNQIFPVSSLQWGGQRRRNWVSPELRW